MLIKELIEKLNKIDPEKPVKLSSPSWLKGKLVGLSHSDINVLCEVEDELWLVNETGTEWLDSMNWQEYYQ